EQNVSVGIANRLLGKISLRVFLGYPEAAAYFDAKKCTPTGNTIRKEFFAAIPPYNPDGKTLLILGGSQGARSINQMITGNLDKLPADLHIIHQTGVSDVESVRSAYQSYRGKVDVVPFIEDMVGTM